MNAEILKERFFELLPPPLPSDWEAEENLEHLIDLSEHRQNLILNYVQAVWPVSNSLCYSYLSYADTALSCLDDEQIGEWVASFLDIYEKEGLKEAQAFMKDVEGNFLCHLRGEKGIELEKAADLLLPYARGIAQKDISLVQGRIIYTDTSSVYLPKRLSVFTTEKENFLLYKLIVTAQLCIISLKVYDQALASEKPSIKKLQKKYSRSSLPTRLFVEDFWNIFPDSHLAEDLYTLSEGFRVNTIIASSFPGLWRDTCELRKQLAEQRGSTDGASVPSRIMETLTQLLTSGNMAGTDLDEKILNIFTGSHTPAEKTALLYTYLEKIKEPYKRIKPVRWIGRLQPKDAREVLTKERTAAKNKFIKLLSAILPEYPATGSENSDSNREPGRKSPSINSDVLAALLIPPAKQDEPERSSGNDLSNKQGKSFTIDSQEIDIPESLKSLAAEITTDLGHIPDEYISSAQGFSGSGNSSRLNEYSNEGENVQGDITYDEWDYRRGGYRKNWCSLNEKIIHPVKGSFVANTLDKYRGPLIKLKKQFEMLRSAKRMVKRQRDGDDIDLDAVIESISDQRAGLSESENLFIKLRHDGRDIAAMFLIDMSSSTEGWVGEALKEALILMGESLEILGDRYAIAGFSGMRRTRSEFFHIKGFDEPYNEKLQGRIAAITPQEYTRMGPAVRHATSKLQKVDAKVRLLIILSDGKPEDYDDYKGEYAIEDTRHALIEAKSAGIHPFCITIDKQAHDYLAHMYGAVNYIFLDKVSDLPLRMPAIYRNLTT